MVRTFSGGRDPVAISRNGTEQSLQFNELVAKQFEFLTNGGPRNKDAEFRLSRIEILAAKLEVGQTCKQLREASVEIREFRGDRINFVCRYRRRDLVALEDRPEPTRQLVAKEFRDPQFLKRLDPERRELVARSRCHGIKQRLQASAHSLLVTRFLRRRDRVPQRVPKCCHGRDRAGLV